MRIIVNVSVKTSMYRIIIFNLAQEDKNKLSEMTGLTEKKIDSWFHKKRQKSGDLIKPPSLSNKYPELKKQFDKDPFLSSEEKLELMNITGLSRTTIENWFQHERKRRRKNGEDLPKNNFKNSFSMKYPQLEEQFKNNPHPNESDFHRLVNETSLSSTQVFDWFLKKQRRNGLSGPVISDRKSREPLSKRFPQLEQQFQTNPNPTKSEKLQLMETTGLTRRQINDYFIKQRKKHQI